MDKSKIGIKEDKSDRAKRVHEWKANEAFGEVTILGELLEIYSAVPPSPPLSNAVVVKKKISLS